MVCPSGTCFVVEQPVENRNRNRETSRHTTTCPLPRWRAADRCAVFRLRKFKRLFLMWVLR
ncbi:MAG: hypothetical protein ACI3X8_02640 [Alloprevotella sp.]